MSRSNFLPRFATQMVIVALLGVLVSALADSGNNGLQHQRQQNHRPEVDRVQSLGQAAVKKPLQNQNRAQGAVKKPAGNNRLWSHAQAAVQKPLQNQNRAQEAVKKPAGNNRLWNHAQAAVQKALQNQNRAQEAVKKPAGNNRLGNHAQAAVKKPPQNQNRAQEAVKKPAGNNRMQNHARARAVVSTTKAFVTFFIGCKVGNRTHAINEGYSTDGNNGCTGFVCVASKMVTHSCPIIPENCEKVVPGNKSALYPGCCSKSECAVTTTPSPSTTTGAPDDDPYASY